ncbi:WD40-repeat-containing domain protein [Podospora aff. communis PSN243]|uniref:WD40-repeat-containing domain protein n=1 Tax=Podospora aff. communis PSN243 TaxID=3040156 RepID=A0AAV9GU46_9PEZI|nr:WD40-repeat-containing domain protein [Podospora aff. communis PSN243]
MGSHLDTNGDTASLKKRKRAPKDEASPLIKRHRSKSTSKQAANGVPEDGSKVNGTPSRRSKAIVQHTDGDVELVDAAVGGELVVCKAQAPWKLSNPMGGRMLDIDPTFSVDERYLILTYNTSLQVYTTEDSLLVRRIPLPMTGDGDFIVSAVLSKASPEHVWVGSNRGRVWHINWTTGAGADTPYEINKHILDMDVHSVEYGDVTKDVLLVLQVAEATSATIAAYNEENLSKKEGTLLYTFEEKPRLLRSAANGKVIVATSGSTFHIGLLRHRKKNADSPEPEYRFYSFGTADLVASLDIRPTLRTTKKGATELQQVDVIIGGARGGIYLYSDIAAKLTVEGHGTVKAAAIQPRKYHWHRKAVHSVKWSADGNYLISGGNEQVLVLWQVDTGKVNFLPHLSGCIENIVVSPQGSSYAIHLDDNSTMVISTEEMKPTTYISGIQSLILGDLPSKDAMVRRVWKPTDEISRPLVTAVNPANPSQMFLCVGNGQQATLGGGGPSTPQVQVFDTSSFRGITKHVLARTNPTDANITSQGAPIVEPTVTKLAFSGDGRWLASVDEWQPPKADTEVFITGRKTAEEVRRERREIYLKFWEVSADGSAVELVTRIEEAHHTSQQETIFDLASDPTSPRFATIGEDGVVRTWTPKLRKRDGIAVTGQDGQQLKAWTCSQTIPLPVSGQQDFSVVPSARPHHSGALTFSEDGSIIFAAFGEPSEVVVVAIDTETGTIRDTIYGMFRGDVRSIKSLGSCLIMLSEDLTVYDVVSDELLYSFSLKETSNPAKRLAQLAVNHESRSFAVAAPIPNADVKSMRKGTKSELLVFSIDDSEPQLVHTFSNLITAIYPAISSSGFVVVDAAAQLWSVAEGAEQAPMLRPLAELGVSDAADEDKQPGPMDLALEDADASDDEMQDGDQDVDMDADDDYDVHQAVVAPQRLAEIFNTAPSFAMPPIEDIFYQVAGLYAPKPVRT